MANIDISPSELEISPSSLELVPKRNKIAAELFSTETTYINCLTILVEKYLTPIKNDNILDEKQIVGIFSSIEIIYSLNMELFQRLEERRNNWNESQKIGDIFLTLGPMFKMYREYCQNFENAVKLLQELSLKKRWKDWLDQVEESIGEEGEGIQLTLSSILIMPLQRLPRYLLLISDLLKNTKNIHPDYEDLVKSEKLLKEICNSMNQYLHDVQERNRVFLVSQTLLGLRQNLVEPHRKVVREGILKKITSRIIRSCYLVLFNDIIVYSHMLLNKRSFKGIIPLNSAWLRDLEDTDKFQHLFQIVGPKKTWTFIAENPKNKSDWINQIQTCIETIVKKHPESIKLRGKVISESKAKWDFGPKISPSDFDKEYREEKQRKIQTDQLKSSLQKNPQTSSGQNIKKIKEELKKQGLKDRAESINENDDEYDDKQPLLKKKKKKKCECCVIV